MMHETKLFFLRGTLDLLESVLCPVDISGSRLKGYPNYYKLKKQKKKVLGSRYKLNLLIF